MTGVHRKVCVRQPGLFVPPKKGAEGLLVNWMRPANVGDRAQSPSIQPPPPPSKGYQPPRSSWPTHAFSQLPFASSQADQCQLMASKLIWLDMVIFLNASCWSLGSFGLVGIYIFFPKNKGILALGITE